ncbi:MAG: TRAP transporter large permease subunit [Rhodobacteraceae bacterium]|nr:TRAP transporter large permease subunit [Paracoccaceae bacterium]
MTRNTFIIALNRWAEKATGLVSVVAIAGLLIGASIIVLDVTGRWLFGTSIVALNEMMSSIFAMAIAATFPAGATNRVHLKVDLLAHVTGTRLTAWLHLAGSVLLTLFFSILAWRIFDLSIRYLEQGNATSLLHLPLWPVYLVVSVLMAATALVQFLHVVNDTRAAIATSGDRRSHVGVLVCMTALAVIVFAGLGWAIWDLKGYSGFVAGHPGTAVGFAFAVLWLGVLAQLPLATVTAFIGIAGTLAYVGTPAAINAFSGDSIRFLRDEQVVTLPLFLIMGAFSVAAGVSEDLFRLGNALLGRFRGGLAYATIAGCAGFGAVCGSSIATSATFGRMALPSMSRLGYAQSLSTASVAAGGTLGALVPPSGAIIMFALLTEESIGALFMAAMIPAALAILLYFCAVFIMVRLKPELAPDVTIGAPGEFFHALRGAIPVVVMFGIVIGGLYGGLFTATESAAVGAVGAFLLALGRGKLNRSSILQVFSQTTATTAMIYALIFGGLMFSFYVNLGQTPDMVSAWIASLDAKPIVVLIILIIIYLLLGSVMDSFGVMIITVPVVTPLILHLGYDMLFWGVLMLVVVEIGMITPPFGMNLFIIKSLDPEVRLSTVMKGVLPFILADLVKIALLVGIPALSLWLPSTM